jgi:putative phosphoesterase
VKHKRIKVGIVSDIHGDVFALEQALARLRAMGCGQILCAGDLLDVEPFGEEVIERLRKAEDVTTIRGNHERWAIERRRRKPDLRKDGLQTCDFGDLAGGGTELSHEALQWLAALPSHWAAELAGVRIAMWHARPGSDMEGIEADKTGPALCRQLLDQAAADVLVVGHTHEPFCLYAGKGRIVNPGPCCSKIGSQTLPRQKRAGEATAPDEYGAATFGVLELPGKRFRVYQTADGVELDGDAEAIAIAEARLADIDAGKTKLLSPEEARRRLRKV